MSAQLDPIESWKARAACKGLPTEWWFPAHGGEAIGKPICRRCPVEVECLQMGLTFPDDWPGMYAGLSWKERVRLRRQMRTDTTTSLCGTDSGYYRHRRNGEQPCQPCKTAHAAAESARNKHRGQALSTAEKYRARRAAGWCAQCASGRHSLHATEAPCTCCT